MDEETRRIIIGVRLEKCKYADELRDLDEKVTADLLADAERFVARMEQYLREVGAIE
ncbi:MAG: hypothetical protein ACE5I2_09570 [Anaerolineae bacterium]